MSGTGSKKKTKTSCYFVLNYTSSSGEIKVLSFEVNGISQNWNKFFKELKEKLNIKQEVFNQNL